MYREDVRMIRSRAMATFGLAVGLLASLADTASAQGREQIQYTTITRRVHGGPTFPCRAVLRSASEYQRFFQTREAPQNVNFDQEFLIIVHLGTQGSQGYTTRVTTIERTLSNPPVVTVKYRIQSDAAAGATIDMNPSIRPDEEPVGGPEAPCELIKVRRLTARDTRIRNGGMDLAVDQVRFYEEGGQDRVGFNVVSRSLMAQGQFEQVTVDYSGDVKVRAGGSEARETRVLLSELDRLATCVRNANLPGLPRTIPTTQYGGKRFSYNFFDRSRKRTTVEGTVDYEGTHADRLRPLAQALDLILGRLERRPVRIEGTVEDVEEADAVRIQGSLGLSFYLRGPLARKLEVLAGRRVVLEAVATLRTATEAEGVIRRVLYPTRSQIAGTPRQSGATLTLVPSPPMPDAPILLLGRAQELAGPEVGKPIMLDMWLFFDDKGLPKEGFVESILAVTIMKATLRDRPEAQSMPNGELPEFTTVWVSSRRGGADGLALAAANNKSGWCASQQLRFTYNPRGLTEGLAPEGRERERIENEVERDRDRMRNPPPPGR
jgi:hypothetical protein